MPRKQITYFVLGSFLIIIAIWAYINYNSQYTLNSVLDAFTSGNYPKAEKLLTSIHGQIPEAKYDLYMGYIKRGERDIPISDQSLQLALQNLGANQQKELAFEIYLNLALNAYLEKNKPKFKTYLEQASNLSPGNDWLVFLNGILDYMQKDYSKALENWETIPWSSSHSAWLQEAFKDAFHSDWVSMRVLRAQIETGDYLTARQSLVEQTPQATTKEEKDTINFLLGITYIKEGSGKSSTSEAPYDELAVSYLNQVDVKQPPYDTEIKPVVELFQKQAEALINDKSYTKAFFYIDTLKKWNAQDELNSINLLLNNKLKQYLADKDWEDLKGLIPVLKTALTSPKDWNQVSVLLHEQLEKSVLAGNSEDMVELLYLDKGTQSNPEATSNEIRFAVLTDLLNYTPVDTRQLNLITPFLNFVLQINDKSLTEQIFGLANMLWETPGMEEKGLNIWVALASDQRSEENIALARESLQEMYKYSLTHEVKGNLLLLAAQADKIGFKDVLSLSAQDKERLSSELDRLEAEGHLSHALDAALFLQKIDPQDPRALLYSGMLSYLTGNYAQAIKLLSTVQNPSPLIEEALYVSKQLSVAGAPPGLEEDFKKPLDRDALLSLGLGKLVQGNYQSSQKWLEQYKEHDDEFTAGLLADAFMQKDWGLVKNLYGQLSPTFQNLESVKALHILALRNSGDPKGAEIELEAVLSNQGRASQSSSVRFSPPFELFRKNFLSSYDRNFIAGIYYLEKQQYGVALDYLFKDPSPTADNFVARADVYESQGNIAKAQEALQQALASSKDLYDPNSARLKVLPRLAKLCMDQGRFEDACLYYADYFKIAPQDEENRADYGNSLRNAEKGVPALKQYNLAQNTRHYSKDDALNVISCYILSDQFDLANSDATRLFSNEDTLNLTQQLKLAKIMIIPKDDNIINRVKQTASAKESMNADEAAAYLELLTELADYDAGEKLIAKNKSLLDDNVKGLMAQANFHKRLSAINLSMEELHKALQIEPFNFTVRAAYNKVARDPESLKEAYDYYQGQLRQDPNSISSQIALSRVLLDMAVDKGVGNESTVDTKGDAEIPEELYHASNFLDYIIIRNTEFPVVFRYRGEAQHMLGKVQDAEDSFNKAIALNPSDYPSYTNLALIAEQKGNLTQAESDLLLALKFSPSNINVWRQLVLVNIKRDLPLETIYSLNQLIKLRPNDFEAYFTLGNQWLELNNPEGAISAFRRVLKLSPDNIHALKSILLALYNPSLLSSSQSQKSLRGQRDEIYKRLHDLDPDLAEKLITQINNSDGKNE